MRFLLLQYFVILLLLPYTIYCEDISIYWGQNTGEGSLLNACSTGYYSIVSISFLVNNGKAQTPKLHLEPHCDAKNCSLLSNDIKYCQKQGIKVFLSLVSTAKASMNVRNSSEDAKQLSDYLWHNFLGGSRNKSCPLGDAVLDGIDFSASTFISDTYMVELSNFLKSHSSINKKVYLSAAQECPFPDQILGKAIQKGLFDYIWVLFYNNFPCEYKKGNADDLLYSWKKWTTSIKKGKVFLGLVASPRTALSGYIPVEVLTSQILGVVRKASNYGGLMIWSRYDDLNTGYSKAILNHGKTIPENKTSYAGNSRREGSKWWIWLIISVGEAAAILMFCYLCGVLSRKYKKIVDRKRKTAKLLAEVGGIALGKYGKYQRTREDGHPMDEMQVFDLETLIAATNNFSLDKKLGEGGFGPVFKGELHDGQEVAIKRLSTSSGQGLIEFKNEAKIMAKLQHTNLVRLLGICIERDERILIYEYMPKKSLDFYLFDASRRSLLDWNQRLTIIQGIAQGLVYLHRYSRVKVIHRDLKPSNVLLDEAMNPKIADFGLAKIFGFRGYRENTRRIVGTLGYMSPEYAINGDVTVKGDVYSFGVMLLEIVTGMKNNRRIDSTQRFNLLAHAWQLWNERRAMELIHPSLRVQYNSEEVTRSIHVGLLCVQEDAQDRPSIEEVVSFLSNSGIQLVTPKKPPMY